MTGGLLQLEVTGSQNIYLTTNPEITFFKLVYKKYSLFSMELRPNTIEGPPDFGKHNLICKINKSGDLINRIYLKVKITGTSDQNFKWAFIKKLGHNLIDYYQLNIGNKIIDKHTGEWLNIWYNLSLKNQIKKSYDKMIGNTDELTILSKNNKEVTLMIPLRFSFNNETGLSLPLISLFEEDIQIILGFKKINELVNKELGITNLNLIMSNPELLINYVYLDNQERQLFMSKEQDYLFEQLQYNNFNLINPRINKINIDFNNSIKSLFWVSKKDKFLKGNLFWGTDVYTATKRFVLAFCRKSTTAFKNSLGVDLSVGDNLVAVANLPTDISNIITNCIVKKIFKSGQDATINDITISNNYLLTSEQISLTISEFINKYTDTAVRNTTGEGSSNHDIVLYQWDNFNLYIDYTGEQIQESSIEINGNNLIQFNTYHYFNMLQAYENYNNMYNGVYLYSFSINPNEHQPSGIMNYSKIFKSRLLLKYNSVFDNDYYINNDINYLTIYALNYNILIFSNGRHKLLIDT